MKNVKRGDSDLSLCGPVVSTYWAASAKRQFCFFTTFRAFAAFFVKSTKKHSLLLLRVLSELVKKVRHVLKAL
jgi:hypothetical protein